MLVTRRKTFEEKKNVFKEIAETIIIKKNTLLTKARQKKCSVEVRGRKQRCHLSDLK